MILCSNLGPDFSICSTNHWEVVNSPTMIMDLSNYPCNSVSILLFFSQSSYQSPRKFRIFYIFLWIRSFFVWKCSSLSLVIIFALIAISSFPLVSHSVRYIFHIFTFNLSVSFCSSYASCMKKYIWAKYIWTFNFDLAPLGREKPHGNLKGKCNIKNY